MDSSDKATCIITGLLATIIIWMFVCLTVYKIQDNNNKLKEFEAAAKAGLVQRVDPGTSRTIWVKPTE